MHELSIAQSLLDIVLEESERHGLKKVIAIRLQVGEMAAVVPDALNFCFESLSERTVAAGATLQIETLPVVARCSQCRISFEVENQNFVCPQCGYPALELVSGRELSVVGIEGETGDRHEPSQCSCSAQHSSGQ